jgi:hypothetical protein
MKPVALALCATLLAAAPASPPRQDAVAQDPSESAAAPAWFRANLAFTMEGGGRWVTDNAAYRSDQEPSDAYGQEWTWGLGQQSITGRLFGLRDGEEVGTFWEFRLFWHPGERRAVLQQFGADGTLLLGTVEPTGEHTHRSEQERFAPDGSRGAVGHESVNAEDGTHVTRSFDIAADGTWTPRRSYTWHRE